MPSLLLPITSSANMGKRIDLTGQRFGRLVVEGFAGTDKKRNVLWSCKCDCGQRRVVTGNNLKSGHTKSCGCSRIAHGKSYTRLHRIWADMKTRCYNPQNRAYKNYGGRGITICDEWRDDFQKFYDWAMSCGYQDNLMIDRTDNDKGYYPDNCRWVNIEVQNNNKRNNIKIEYQGKVQTLAQWSKELEIEMDVLWHRINVSGWSIEKAFSIPTDERKSHKEK